ncbi:MAG: glycosyltransferase family 39 protein [Deltaproteobacteria bacterium]|nr:glycosyltransferase family 39 protein [Deltaproteobacteria bacterium]
MRPRSGDDSTSRTPRLGDWLWLLACLLLSSAWCLSAGTRLGATFDEPLYLRTGLADWHAGGHRGLMRLGTMPLQIDVATLPLAHAERSRGAPFDVATELPQILPQARAMTLAFWILLLISGWRAGRVLAGPWGGRLAVALLASEPSLLAHASLATTDIALAACLLAFAVQYRGGVSTGWAQRVLLPGIWFGLALLAKASALVMAPLSMLVIALGDGRRDRAALRDGSVIIAAGLALAFVYCGSDWQSEPSFLAWARAQPADAVWQPAVQYVAEHLRIFTNAGEAIVRQIRHNLRGHGSFLLGIADPHALWFFFPVLLTIKLSEPLLLLSVAGGAAALRRWWHRAATDTVSQPANWPLRLAAVLILYSLTFRVQLGIRMVLPIVAYLAVGVGIALARAITAATEGWPRRGLAAVAAAAIGFNVFTVSRLWPDGLVFVNRLWGGPTQGYRLVSDSNYDWGQGIPALRAWQADRQIAPLSVWYFGTDPRAAEPPLQLVALHDLPLASRDDVLAALDGRVLAVGATLLYGSGEARGSDAHRQALAVLRERAPFAHVGTFLIYDFR